jgi:hypothetical protein
MQVPDGTAQRMHQHDLRVACCGLVTACAVLQACIGVCVARNMVVRNMEATRLASRPVSIACRPLWPAVYPNCPGWLGILFSMLSRSLAPAAGRVPFPPFVGGKAGMAAQQAPAETPGAPGCHLRGRRAQRAAAMHAPVCTRDSGAATVPELQPACAAGERLLRSLAVSHAGGRSDLRASGPPNAPTDGCNALARGTRHLPSHAEAGAELSCSVWPPAVGRGLEDYCSWEGAACTPSCVHCCFCITVVARSSAGARIAVLLPGRRTTRYLN